MSQNSNISLLAELDRPIPQFNDLAEIYPASTVPREGARWNELLTRFQAKYNAAATHIIRAPGRVNILGEHVDYSQFPVLPAAIQQDILVAVRATSPHERTVRLANVFPSFHPSDFVLTPPTSCDGGWDANVVLRKDGELVPFKDGPSLHVKDTSGWENYLKVALLECLDLYYPGGKPRPGSNASSDGPVGMDLLITGSVPPGAGLSSSAAFVVSSVITFLVANNLTDGVSKGDIVRLSIASEHRMGLKTGGMDQSASTLSLPNKLLHLSFFPALDPKSLPLPSSLTIVVTNSLAPHSLADTAPERYNLRVVEVLVASRLLMHAWGVDSGCGGTGANGRISLRQATSLWGEKLGCQSDEKLNKLAFDSLPGILGRDGRDTAGWTVDETVEASGMPRGDFEETYLNYVPVRAERFHLFKRAQHTFAEVLRVARFTELCQDLDGSPHPPSPAPDAEEDPRVVELGELLNLSHESLRDLYECSVPQVEELRDLCLANGALGTRQTGGGWGGAVISLLPVDKAPAFLKAIRRAYKPYRELSGSELDDAAFATLPGSGAGVYVVGDTFKDFMDKD